MQVIKNQAMEENTLSCTSSFHTYILPCLTGKSKKSSVSGLKLENDKAEVSFNHFFLWSKAFKSLLNLMKHIY